MTDVEPIAVPAEDALERSVARRTRYAAASAWGGWVAALILGLGIAAAIYFFQRPSSGPVPGVSREAPSPAPVPGATIRHPLPEALVRAVPSEPLPPLEHSDGALGKPWPRSPARCRRASSSTLTKSSGESSSRSTTCRARSYPRNSFRSDRRRDRSRPRPRMTASPSQLQTTRATRPTRRRWRRWTQSSSLPRTRASIRCSRRSTVRWATLPANSTIA